MADQLHSFVTAFLGIFIEAAPFLLAGSIASGFVEVFVGEDRLSRLLGEKLHANVMFGALLGLVVPVCECGVIPLTRRLARKGLPAAAGISFILAAPAINPIAIAGTYAAFGPGKILVLRIGLTLVVSILVTLLVSRFHKEILREDAKPACACAGSARGPQSLAERLWSALGFAADDFLDMARFLVAGCLVAAAMQTFVTREAILSLARSPVLSVPMLQVLAFVLSLCSSVDSFVALAFARTFSTGAVLGFLVFGPMVDIKSTMMLLGVFRWRVVLAMATSAFLLSWGFAVLVNLCAR